VHEIRRPDPNVRQRSPWALVIGALASMAVVAAACGGDEPAADAPGATSPGVTSSAPGPSSAGGGGGSGPGTPAPRPLAERTKVVILPGSAAIEAFSPPYLAEQLGEFEKENLDVDLQVLPASDGLVQLQNGAAALELTGIHGNIFNANHAGGDFRYIANTHGAPEGSEEGLWVRNEYLEPDRCPNEDFRGAMVGLGTSGITSPSGLPVQKWLESCGWSLQDVTISNLNTAELLLALENGAVAAGYLITPAWQQAVSGGYAQFVTQEPPYSAGVYVMTQAFIDDDEEVAKAIMRAIMRTIRTYLQGDYHQDPVVMEAMAEALGSPLDALLRGPSLTFDPNMGMDTEGLEELQVLWLDLGDILQYDEPLPPSDLVDTRLIDEVRAGR
jgi:NitT/TauT family transport system substrate-binding protein